MRDTVFAETGIEERDVHHNLQRLKIWESEEWKALRAEYDEKKAKFLEDNKEKIMANKQKFEDACKKAGEERKKKEEAF